MSDGNLDCKTRMRPHDVHSSSWLFPTDGWGCRVPNFGSKAESDCNAFMMIRSDERLLI
jgi:hypothetical protein